MQYEHFSRHLREKYSTRLHVADQLVDQLKRNTQSSINHKNMIKVQREISFPLISYLNKIDYDKQKSIENKKVFEPYFNECILAAERMKKNRRSEKDRQICYENLILAQKLECIKNQSGQNAKKNLEKDYQNHCRLLISKANCEHDAIKAINKRFITKNSLLSNEKILDSNEERFSETVFTSYHSPSPIQSKSETSLSENEDDQATAADVDVSMEYCDSIPPVSCKKPLRKQRNNCAQSISTKYKEIHSSNNQNQRFFLETENDRMYQHLSNIDMTMIRDSIPLPTSQTSKHFSICILPHFDSDTIKPMNNHSKVLSHDRQYAFKKEILYH